jgi:exopolysaccharide biosynthesis polyprenyl glycosylphosphotransferase
MLLILALIECGLVGAAVGAAIHLGSGPTAGSGHHGIALGLSLGFSLSCAVALSYQQLYDRRAVRTIRGFLSRMSVAAGLPFLLALALWKLIEPSEIDPLYPLVILAALLATLLMLRAVVYLVEVLHPFARRNLVLGAGPLAMQIVQELEAQTGSREELVGVVTETAEDFPLATAAPIFGTLEDFDTLLSRTDPTRIVVALDERRGRLPVRRLLEARVRGVAVEDGAEVLERLSGKIAIESVSPGVLAFSRDFRASRFHDTLARAGSVLAAIAGLVLFAPIMALIAMLIKLDSRGPVLFIHERVGQGGRRFNLLKFRTMAPAARATSEWARDNEDRITRVGRWLRRFRLDEWPQFVNILRGDLNLIGPRPHPASNFDLFTRIVPYYWLRSMVRPGVTGWAQVRYGYANNLQEETEKMRYDLYYIKHRSLRLDARILLQTAKVVILGSGAESTEAAMGESGPYLSAAAARLPHLLLRRDTSRTLAGRGSRIAFAFTNGYKRGVGPRPS